MKVSVSGKGGSGKTTISGTLARLAGRKGRAVVAIDADTNPNLALTLGLGARSLEGIVPLPHGLMVHEHVDGETRLSLARPLHEITAEYACECPDNVRLLTIGSVRGAGTGWMCSSHATVRGLLHEIASDDPLVVVDSEASPEHLSRATVEAVDLQLVVAEPYFKSLETARRYARLGAELGIPSVGVVANKVKSAEDEQAIRDFCSGHEVGVVGVVPFDESFAGAERAGVAPLDFGPATPGVDAIASLLDEVVLQISQKAGWAMEKLHQPKSDALRTLFWRDEILQVMFWMQGEGFGDKVDPAVLERFLGVDAALGVGYLDKLVDEGLLGRDADGRYQLTDEGRSHGARVFADEFAELTRPAHGECGPDCWCHASVEEAEACAEERLGHQH